MITWVRTANINDGKGRTAFAWAVKVAAYVNENVSGADVQVMRNIGGPVWQVHWVANYESLAALAEVMKQIEGDAGYLEVLAEAQDQKLFIGTSIVDNIYEAIS